VPDLAFAEGERPKAVVPSVLKAARVLDSVAASRDPLTLASLRRQLGLPKSSILSLCTSLTVAGLLRRQDDGAYQLGARVLDLAHAYLAQTDLPQEFMCALGALPELTEATVLLAIREGTEVVYTACQNSARTMGVSHRVGMRLPASCTATGKSLLASLPDVEIRRIYRGTTLPQLTSGSARTLSALLKDIADVRLKGFSVDDEETCEGTYCVGVPVAGEKGAPALAAVAVTMLKGGNYLERAAVLLPALQLLAVRLRHPAGMLT
jgi:DNA-binding IclR family transcriptional regulator